MLAPCVAIGLILQHFVLAMAVFDAWYLAGNFVIDGWNVFGFTIA